MMCTLEWFAFMMCTLECMFVRLQAAFILLLAKYRISPLQPHPITVFSCVFMEIRELSRGPARSSWLAVRINVVPEPSNRNITGLNMVLFILVA